MSEHEYEKFTEKEEAIVDGVDISGIWNRMYEPRELTGYDLTFMDKVTEPLVLSQWDGAINVHNVLGCVR